MLKLMLCVKSEPFLRGHVGVRHVCDDLLAAVLLHGYMDDGGLSPKLDIFDCEQSWSSLGSSQELNVQSNGVWLILLCQRRAEVRLDSLENTARHITTIWHYMLVSVDYCYASDSIGQPTTTNAPVAMQSA